jgi:hypothetical protein
MTCPDNNVFRFAILHWSPSIMQRLVGNMVLRLETRQPHLYLCGFACWTFPSYSSFWLTSDVQVENRRQWNLQSGFSQSSPTNMEQNEHTFGGHVEILLSRFFIWCNEYCPDVCYYLLLHGLSGNTTLCILLKMELASLPGYATQYGSSRCT